MTGNSESRPGLRRTLWRTVVRAPGLSLGLLLAIAGAVVFGVLPPLALERIVDGLTAGEGVPLKLCLLYFGLIVLSGLFDSARELAITVFGQRITHGLRSELCAKLTRLPAGYYTAHDSGQITSLFVNDVDTVENLFTNGVVSMFADVCSVAAILAVVFTRSVGLGILLLLALPPLFVLTRGFQKRMLAAQLENRRAVARVNNHLPETLKNLRMIRCFCRREYMEEKYDGYIADSYRAVDRSNLFDSVYSPIIILSGSVITALVLCLAATGGTMQRLFGMSVGTAVAMIAYVGKVFDPLESIGMEIQNIQSAAAGVRRIHEFLRLEERASADPALTAERVLSQREAGIRLERVTFGYDREHPVLIDRSFAVTPGEAVTLMGRTGAGKSTVFKLLLGLYEPDEGMVSVFGVPAGKIPDREKRKIFGFVEQSFCMVPGSVLDQITLYDPSIRREDAQQAARLVGLDEMIRGLDRGYDTPCRRSMFSQGQLQLLSIARAVAANPPVLLLDEITANLDSATERRVLDALEQASRNRTVLSISHRLYEQRGGRRIELEHSRAEEPHTKSEEQERQDETAD